LPPREASYQKNTKVCHIQGTNSASATKSNPEVLNQAVIVGRNTIGYVNLPYSYIRQTCVKNSNDTCSAQNSSSVPRASGSANSGYQISCPASVRDSEECSNRAFFASEQGCAFGRVQTIWGFGFKAGTVGCNANVDKSSANTVAIVARPLDKNIVCELKTISHH
jgi:hypothetical protein